MYREAKARLGTRCGVGRGDHRPGEAPPLPVARGARAGTSGSPGTRPSEIVAAAHVHTIKTYGPDRVAGFSPDPGDVDGQPRRRFPVHRAGRRRHDSFYDWYADLPVASPQVFGDQTDVPESGDWWNATYLLMWGSNVPVTRTPDAHWMAEARYKGQKVVVVSPDYADNTKFADTWLPAQPGTDGALAMAMGHVILKEFFVDRRVPFFVDYVQRYTDLPFLVTLRGGRRATCREVPHRRRPGRGRQTERGVEDGAPRRPPPASRWCRTGRWGSATPRRAWAGGTSTSTASTPQLTLLGGEARAARCCCRASTRSTARGGVLRRGVPGAPGGREAGHHRLRPVARPVRRAARRSARQWPSGYDDADEPYTPAWQEPITSVPAAQVVRMAREMAAQRRGVRRPHP